MTATPSSHRAGILAERMIRWFGLCSLAVVLVIWLLITFAGDRAWWTVMLIFGPRWVLALPWLGVVPWLLIDLRRAILPALLGGAIAVFGVIDFHLGLHRASLASGVPFKTFELNAEGPVGAQHVNEILAEIRLHQPDLIVIAECDPTLATALAPLTEYEKRVSDPHGLCLFSRGAIQSWEQRDPHDLWRQSGAGYIVRAVVATTAGPVRVGLVHLATPRHALDSYFDLSELPKQGPNTEANMTLRDEESSLARQWILSGPTMPTIVAGDFNLTTESAIYKRYWGDFRNAFGRAGFGAGYSKHTKRWGVRIDHVLTSNDIGTHASFTGHDVHSDHLPLIAELVLPSAQRTTTAR